MADKRKEWLRDFVPGTFVDHRAARIALADFINRELILFSMADNVRSIPSVMDGLKPGHRKILFACFKRNLKSEIKVAQLAGYVAEHSAYHHGEQSLCATIIGLAQDFVGSNNINLLEPVGQFGTRLQGGKDAASPRYITTYLTQFSRLLYREEDDALLNFLNDDGQAIEPEWYLPIIPMVLVNGGEGIGTGWSTFIPNYNPLDIVSNLKRLINGEPLTEIHPWYAGFNGEITLQSPGKYLVKGKWNRLGDQVIEITELPIGSWTQPYKEMLEEMMNPADGKQAEIKDFSEYHTDTSVHFRITLSKELSMSDAEIEKKFKLTSTITTSNLVTFDRAGRIHKYSDPLTILSDFYDIRLEYYHKRKEHLVGALERAWTILDNKARFIRQVISGEIVVAKRTKENIIKQLASNSYFNLSTSSTIGEEDTSTSYGGYEYLLSMPIHSLTSERISKLEEERNGKELELQRLLAKTPKDLWLSDLEEFTVKWNEKLTGDNKKLSKNTTGRKVGSKGKAMVEEEVQEVSEEDTENYKPKATTKRTKTLQTHTDTLTEPINATSAKVAKDASKKQSTLATFLPSQQQKSYHTSTSSSYNASQEKQTKPDAMIEDDDMDLPLAQRIAKMLRKSD
jgi:DNA topoisomerase II